MLVEAYRRWRLRREVRRVELLSDYAQHTVGHCTQCGDATDVFHAFGGWVCVECWARLRLGLRKDGAS